jgi:hypothetical protein
MDRVCFITHQGKQILFIDVTNCAAEELPKVFYEALKIFSQREFRKFKTREEAMDWLVREEG